MITNQTRKEMMDIDTELIMSAVSSIKPKPRTQKMLQEIDDNGVHDFEFEPTVTDAISKLAKKVQRTEKRRRMPVVEWTSVNFLTFINEQLKTYGFRLADTGRKYDLLMRLYDKLAVHLGMLMSNQIFKEYLEWWIVTYAPTYNSHELAVQIMGRDSYIETFVDRYKSRLDTGKLELTKKSVVPKKDITDDKIYDTGGLPMLLMSRGIAISFNVMRSKGEKNIFTRISKSLREFSKDILLRTIEVTVNRAPYNESGKVDFVALAKPALDFYGIKKFKDLDYNEYFKDK